MNATEVEPFSERELKVPYWLVSGASNLEIRRYLLYITKNTVERLVHNIFGKLYVNNHTWAALRANRFGVIPQIQQVYL